MVVWSSAATECSWRHRREPDMWMKKHICRRKYVILQEPVNYHIVMATLALSNVAPIMNEEAGSTLPAICPCRFSDIRRCFYAIAVIKALSTSQQQHYTR
ncbi:uncharacterized protein PHA67_007870 isoform 2-T2 [Liasis olivaceus]